MPRCETIGAGWGEASALLWSDVDLKNSTITVSKSFDFKQNTIKPPKNGKSRTVTIPKVLTNYLHKLPKKSTFVITNKQGGMMTESSWKRLLESYLCDMNLRYGKFAKEYKKFSPEKVPFVIEPFTLHCQRHTFCTMMCEAGGGYYGGSKADGTLRCKNYPCDLYPP